MYVNGYINRSTCSDGEPEQGSGPLWLANLGLSFRDQNNLHEDSAWLSDILINACQTLLKEQYPHVGGFQNTLFGKNF